MRWTILLSRLVAFGVSAVILTEGILRLCLFCIHGGSFRPIQFFVNDPIYGFRPVPHARDWQDGYEWNSAGFRGPELEANELSRKLRVFCVGGSTTFGTGNSIQTTYPYLLQKKFLDRLEVINAGVGGWGMAQYYERLRGELINYHPDVILLESTINSMTYSAPYFRNGEFPTYGLFNHSFLFKIVDKALSLTELGAIHYPLVRVEPTENDFEEVERRLLTGGPDQYRSYLDRFSQVATDHQIKVIQIEPPLRGDSLFLENRDRADLMNARVRGLIHTINLELSKKHGTQLLDLTALFLNERNIEKFFMDAVHPSAEGNRLIVEAVYQELNKCNSLFHGPEPAISRTAPSNDASDRRCLFGEAIRPRNKG